jgi:hypothetical protein
MSSYLDPVTALMIARAARDEETRAAEQYHAARSLRRRPAGRRRGWKWPSAWPRPAIAH